MTDQFIFAQNLTNFHSDVLCCTISSKEPHFLAIGCSNKLVRIFNFDHVTQKFAEFSACSPLKGHEYQITGCHFSLAGRLLLVTCSQDGKAILWLPPNFDKICIFEHPSNVSLRICRFSPNSLILATGSDDETVCLWDLANKNLITQLSNFEDSVVALDFSPDSLFLATGTCTGDLKIWFLQWVAENSASTSDRKTSLSNLEKEAHDLGVTCCRFKPAKFDEQDQKMTSYLLATGGNDNLIKLWNLHINNCNHILLECVAILNRHTSNVMCLDFSPDGAQLASGSGDKLLIFWDVNKRLMLKEYMYHTSYVTCCSFSTNGRFLISGSNDKRVAVWQSAKFDTASCENVDFHDVEILLPVNKESNKNFNIKKLSNDKCANFSNRQNFLNPNLNRENRHDQNRIQIPNEFLCPITRELMRDPVVAADGFTYERSAIKEWFDLGNRTSPMTNVYLQSRDLTSNLALKVLIHNANLK